MARKKAVSEDAPVGAKRGAAKEPTKAKEPIETKEPKAAKAPPAKKQKADEGSAPSGAQAGKPAAAKVPEGPIPRSETPRAAAAAGSFSVLHWNVGGLNGLLKNACRAELLQKLVREEHPAVVTFSEHKLQEGKVGAAVKAMAELCPGYSAAHWAVSTAKKGYAGVAALVRDGVSVHNVEIDAVCDLHEGRTISLELDEVWVVAAYVPNSGQSLERLSLRIESWDAALASHVAALEQRGKPVLLIGDLNVAPLDADIWNFAAKHIPKSAGTTPQERASFARLVGAEGAPYAATLADAFRTRHPKASGVFSYWSQRAGANPHGSNKGLRLDHALLSQSIVGGSAPLALHDCQLLHEYAPNGDHCPILCSLVPK